MFWKKLRLRTKIISAIAVSILLSFGFITLISKKSSNIPVSSLSYVLEINQGENYALNLESIKIVQKSSPDYQTNIPENYYRISIQDGNRELFQGRTVKEYVLIKEIMMPETADHDTTLETIPLGKFTLNLPYYNQGERIVLYDESDTEVLNVNIKEQNLTKPPIVQSCGDGICSDDENILMCYSDCSF